MVKRSKRRSGKRRSGVTRLGAQVGSRLFRQSYTTALYFNTASTSAVTFLLHPLNFGFRSGNMAALFENYRIVGLRARFHPLVAVSTAAAFAWGFVPGTLNTAPVNFEAVVESTNSLVKTYNETVPTNYVLRRKDLFGNAALKWWRFQSDGIDQQFTNQGAFYYACSVSSATSMFVEMTVDVEYAGPTAEADTTPLAAEHKVASLERKATQSADGALIVSRGATGLGPTLDHDVLVVDGESQVESTVTPKAHFKKLRPDPIVLDGRVLGPDHPCFLQPRS